MIFQVFLCLRVESGSGGTAVGFGDLIGEGGMFQSPSFRVEAIIVVKVFNDRCALGVSFGLMGNF